MLMLESLKLLIAKSGIKKSKQEIFFSFYKPLSHALFFFLPLTGGKKKVSVRSPSLHTITTFTRSKSASVPLNYVYAADNAISSCSNDGSKNQTSVYMEYVRDNYHSFLLSLKSALTLINKLHAIR